MCRTRIPGLDSGCVRQRYFVAWIPSPAFSIRSHSMSLALLFAGQGAQKVGMGRSLYAGSPAARALYEEADRVLGWDLPEVSFEGPEAELTQTRVCQPALYVHGMALVAALREVRGDFQPAVPSG